jgi:hypothetical protein
LPNEVETLFEDKDETGRTPLMTACCEGLFSTTSLLLRHGADPRTADSDGQTAAHWAFAMGHIQVGDLVMEAQPELSSIPDGEGMTPLQWRAKAIQCEADNMSDTDVGVAEESKVERRGVDQRVEESKNITCNEAARNAKSNANSACNPNDEEAIGNINPNPYHRSQQAPLGLSHRNHMSDGRAPPNLPMDMDSHSTLTITRLQCAKRSSQASTREEVEEEEADSRQSHRSVSEKARQSAVGFQTKTHGGATPWQSDRESLENAMAADAALLAGSLASVLPSADAEEIRSRLEQVGM